MNESMALVIALSARDAASEVLGNVHNKVSALGKVGELAAVGLAAVATTAVAAAGSLFAMGEGAASAAEKVRTLERQTGLTAEAASELSYAGDRVGVSTETMEKSFGILSKNLEHPSAQFKELNVDVVKNAQGNTDLQATVALLADRFKGMPDGVEKTALAMAVFGRGGKEMIPLLNQGSDGLKNMGEEAKKLGLVFSQDAVNSAHAFTLAQKDLEDQFTAVRNQVGIFVLPILTALFGFLVGVAKDVLPPFINLIKTIVTVFSEIFGVISGNAPDAGAKLTELVGPERAKAIMSFIADVRENFKKLFAGDIPGFIHDLIGTFTNWLQNLKDAGPQIEDTVKGWTQAFVHWLGDSAIPWLIANLPGIIGTLLHFFLFDVPNALASVVISVGKGIVEGLWSGIQSAGGWFKDRVGEWIDEHIPSFIKDLLQQHSPSAVMVPIGLGVSQGLAQGILSGQGAVGSAVQAVVGHVMYTADQVAKMATAALATAGASYGVGGQSHTGVVTQTNAAAGIFASAADFQAYLTANPTFAATYYAQQKYAEQRSEILDAMAGPGSQRAMDEGKIFPSSGGGGGISVNVNVDGNVVGVADLQRTIVSAVREGVQSGGFHGVIPAVGE